MIAKTLLSGCLIFILSVANAQKPKPGIDPTRPAQPGFLNVSDAMTVTFSGFSPGEVQSTVIPPGKKSECPNGRLLISNDVNFSLTNGPVQWRDLDQPNSSNATMQSNFE